MKKDLLQSDVKICLREVFYAQKNTQQIQRLLRIED